MTNLHISPYCGSWYPGSRVELERMLERIWNDSRERTGAWTLPRPAAFLVPHAGLAYSGTVAAAAYRQLQAAAPARVFLLGFSHSGARKGVFVPDVEAIDTPLGPVEIDTGAVSRLAAAHPFQQVEESDLCDHSVEIQLPLLKFALPDCRVVPIYVGPMPQSDERAAAEALAGALGPGDVLLASSDLTHYGRDFGFLPFPVDRDTQERLREIDEQVLEAASSLDAELFAQALAETGSTTCGRWPLDLLFETLSVAGSGNLFGQTLDYQTSGEMTGGFSHSVSYGAVGWWPEESFRLDEADARTLLTSATATLDHLRRTGERKPVHASEPGVALERSAGVFVSLHQHGELLGCIGSWSEGVPMWRRVPDMTLAAAMDDPRFSPAGQSKGEIDVEVSIMTPMKRLRDASAFRVGIDGAFLQHGWQRGLLLPQVGRGPGWTATKFLDALSRKAGLGPGAYKSPGAKLFTFRAQIIE
jgi:hypothetical protein